MTTNGTWYSPAFKFQVVLEVLKAERKGGEAQVARPRLSGVRIEDKVVVS